MDDAVHIDAAELLDAAASRAVREAAIAPAMRASYSVDPEEHVLRMKVWGELTADSLIRLLNHIGADPNYTFGMPAIADYRDAYGDWDYSEIQRFRDYLLQLQASREVRWAAVVKPGMLVAVGRVLIVISEALNAPIRIKLFEDPHSALRWIRSDSADD